MFMIARDRDRAVCRGGADYLPLSPNVDTFYSAHPPARSRAADFGYDWGAIHDN
jgi:hypothetical protein